MAVIIPNDQWSPSQQGEEEEEEDDWSEFMPKLPGVLRQKQSV